MSPKRYVLKEVEQESSVFILKSLKSNYPTLQELNRLRLEYEVLKKFDNPFVVKALEFKDETDQVGILMEKVPGVSLEQVLQKRELSLEDCLSLSRNLILATKEIHSKGIIHTAISPDNIILRENSMEPVICGFSLAQENSRLGMEPNTRNLKYLDLNYISPEQTGRMNKLLDYRSDYYSLGAIIYRLLGERKLYKTSDPLEIMHSHMAKSHFPLDECKRKIPSSFCRLVDTLLDKEAGNRYQSVDGLLNDFDRCFDLYKSDDYKSTFKLKEYDIPQSFILNDKLYGRQNELLSLVKRYEESSKGEKNIIFISGYSGVGKSSLVAQLKKYVEKSTGYFISGKVDQFKREIPYVALIGAFRDLVRQLLRESDDHIQNWRSKILKIVGGNGKILIDIIPEMEALIGPQPDVATLPPLEDNNRFQNIIDNITSAFASKKHPLCIFLDDLQWSDSGTRNWIERQASAGNNGYVMIVGAYRDNEVDESHPLSMLMRRLKKELAFSKEIHLNPLNKSTLNFMISENLNQDIDECADLSDLIFQKTDGNPYFSKQCLLSLYEKGAISYDHQAHNWKYDLESANIADLSSNVVDLMLDQLKNLSEDAIEIMKIAGCLGNVFEKQLVIDCSEHTAEHVDLQLLSASKSGFLAPIHRWDSDVILEYKFLHDRIQQAALELTNEDFKKRVRLKVARVLLGEKNISEIEDNIYEIVDHFNYSQNLITDNDEKENLLRLNLSASKKALSSSAFKPALKYINIAMDRLDPMKGVLSNDLIRDIILQKAETEHLNGNNELAESYYDKAIQHSQDPLTKADSYLKKINYFSNLRKFNEAYQTGRVAVKNLGVSIPAKFSPPHLIKEIITYNLIRKGKKLSDIPDLPEMEDEYLRKAIMLMATFARAAYQIKPQLCVAICAQMVNLCLKKGNADGIYIGYLAFGTIFYGAILNRKQSGYDFGQLTLALVEKYNASFYRAETSFVVGYFAIPWRKSAMEMEKYWVKAYDSGLEVGDYFHASCASIATVQSMYMRGVRFEEIESVAHSYESFLKNIKNSEALLTIKAVLQAIKNLKGKTIQESSFTDSHFNEEESIKQYKEFQSRHFAHYYFINKMQTLYLWGNYSDALEVSKISDEYLKDSPGMLHTAEHFFYKGLILARLILQEKGLSTLLKRKKLKSIVDKFKKYAKGNSSNFEHKYKLLKAEYLNILGETENAEKLYFEAIESASNYGYRNVHSIANLLAMKFHLAFGRKEVAAMHFKQAQNSLNLWGAKALSDRLLTEHRDLEHIWETFHNKSEEQDLHPSLLGGFGEHFDLNTLVKSYEALSEEVHLNGLMESLSQVIVENAGADRMLLFLNQNNKLFLLSESNVDSSPIVHFEQTLDEFDDVPASIINYVMRSLDTVVLGDASNSGDFSTDLYFQNKKVKSVMCSPMLRQGNLTGVIYLENSRIKDAFQQENVNLIRLLSGQMAISIENAILYENLEEKVKERTKELEYEKNKSDELLLNILPAETAAELKSKGSAEAHLIEQVTVLFTDFKGFTQLSETMVPKDLVAEINEYFSEFDKIMDKWGVEKIKTIGDSYMAAGGLPSPNSTHASDVVNAALEIQEFIRSVKKRKIEADLTFFEVRIGVHTGPVVAGIVGIKKFQYDIWGDTVNTASRMENSCEVGKVNISETTYQFVKDEFECTHRGKILAKSKGKIDMYFVEGVKQKSKELLT